MYNKKKLITFLEDLDEKLKGDIEIITLGGSALSLLDLKDFTQDIDFFIKGLNYEEMEGILEKLKDKYRRDDVDYWEDGKIILNKEGRIVTQLMPNDYSEIAETIDLKLKNIKVKILNPIDIILTKVGRCNEEDIDDIRRIEKKFKIEKEVLVKRFNQYLENYDGSKNILNGNFKYICDEIYGG